MNTNDLTRSQQITLIALVEELAMSDGTIAEGESKEIGKLASELGDETYRELLEDVNTQVPDTDALKQRLAAITDQEVRETVFGLAMEETLLGPSAKHEQWEMLAWLKEQWGITVES